MNTQNTNPPQKILFTSESDLKVKLGSIGKDGIDFKILYDKDKLCIVQSYSLQITQAIMNMFKNASVA